MPSTQPNGDRRSDEPDDPADERHGPADEPTDGSGEKAKQADAEDGKAEDDGPTGTATDETDDDRAADEPVDDEADPARPPATDGILRGPLVLAITLTFVVLQPHGIRPD